MSCYDYSHLNQVTTILLEQTWRRHEEELEALRNLYAICHSAQTGTSSGTQPIQTLTSTVASSPTVLIVTVWWTVEGLWEA